MKLWGYVDQHGTYTPLWGVRTSLLNFLFFVPLKGGDEIRMLETLPVPRYLKDKYLLAYHFSAFLFDMHCSDIFHRQVSQSLLTSCNKDPIVEQVCYSRE